MTAAPGRCTNTRITTTSPWRETEVYVRARVMEMEMRAFIVVMGYATGWCIVARIGINNVSDNVFKENGECLGIPQRRAGLEGGGLDLGECIRGATWKARGWC
jgi:hypothetical protein